MNKNTDNDNNNADNVIGEDDDDSDTDAVDNFTVDDINHLILSVEESN